MTEGSSLPTLEVTRSPVTMDGSSASEQDEHDESSMSQPAGDDSQGPTVTLAPNLTVPCSTESNARALFASAAPSEDEVWRCALPPLPPLAPACGPATRAAAAALWHPRPPPCSPSRPPPPPPSAAPRACWRGLWAGPRP